MNLMISIKLIPLTNEVVHGDFMSIKNAIYAQSGGVTAVINASACGVIQTARLHPEK